MPKDMGGTDMLRAIIIAAGIAAVALAGTPPAEAQVSKEEILRSLTPKTPITRSLRRKIEVIPGKEAEALDQNKELPKLNLTIEFEYDSDRLTPQGMRQLTVLGDALKDPNLKNFRFMLAGHTDAKGTDDYNQRLSDRRAASVKQYLIGVLQIDPARLQTVGFGKSRLVDQADPFSAKNRRVEVINLLN
jgi:outer membrane protein OmpA-like peptidoglycan-associated protein